jgi:hypothetical protein
MVRIRSVDRPSGMIGVLGVLEKVPGVGGTRLGVDGTGDTGGNEGGIDN